MSVLVLGDEQIADLRALAARAEASPVDMPALLAALETPEGKARHMAQMTAQTVELPRGFLVTFSLEDGHPIGRCRHMSMSVGRGDVIPNHHAVWLVAQQLGFKGSYANCAVWPEDLEGHGVAVNLVQPAEFDDLMEIEGTA